MLDLTVYMDHHGVITQHPKDGADPGDSAHRHGIRALYEDIWSVGDKFVLEYFFTPEGLLIRHPDGSKEWVRELDRGSRDQYSPWLAALALKQEKALLKKIAKLLLKNYSRFFNTRKNGTLDAPLKQPDLAGAEVWATIIRGLAPSWTYPVIYPVLSFLDLEALIGTVVWNNFRDGDSDIINHIGFLKVSNELMPTVVSKLALSRLDKPRAILKLKHYWDYPGVSPEPEKDPNYLGQVIIDWLEKQ